jgi:Ser/Thr protein kinase RdoA (MazF antagonist)
MPNQHIPEIVNQYLSEATVTHIEVLNSGLINQTWKVTTSVGIFILQRVNHNIFTKPEELALNVEVLGDYLTTHHPHYQFPSYIHTRNGTYVYVTPGAEHFRMLPYIGGSHTIKKISYPEEAYEAAKQFGMFTKNLKGFDLNQLFIPIQSFHDLDLRFSQFQNALIHGNQKRIEFAKNELFVLHGYANLVDLYRRIVTGASFYKRVMHHDTKISNVLFDANRKGLCVIDLDTVMPGYFFSDVGDMIRTYISPVTEDETSLEKIEVRRDVFEAMAEGYLSQMGDELSSEEKNLIVDAGLIMVYMQALRFATDFFMNDIYYTVSYENQNLDRLVNQLSLLKKLDLHRKELKQLIGRKAL